MILILSPGVLALRIQRQSTPPDELELIFILSPGKTRAGKRKNKHQLENMHVGKASAHKG